MLRTLGAPEKCVIISENHDLDKKEAALAEALDECVGAGFGFFLSCIPGKVAYFEAEDLGERYILLKK